MSKYTFLIPLFFIGILSVAFYPIFFGGWIFAHLDTQALFYPYYQFYHHAIQTGQSFLWSPWIFSGSPVYLTQNGGFLDPVNRIIFSFFDGIPGVHIRMFLDFFLTLLFAYSAGRAFGLSRGAASLIGIAYLPSVIVRFLTVLPIANGLFLSPFLLYVFSKIKEREVRWRTKILWSVAGGIGIGWALLSGMTQLVVYSVTLFAVFVLAYYLVYERHKVVPALLHTFSVLIPMVGIGFLAALPQILPVLRYVPLSVRSEGVSLWIALGRSIELGDFLLFLFPAFLYFPYVSVGSKTMYVGAFFFFLALSLAAIIWENRTRVFGKSTDAIDQKLRLSAVITIVCATALAIAINYSPLAYILQQLPVFKLFRYIDRWMWVGTFYLAFMGALGFDLIRDHQESRILKSVFAGMGVIVGGITGLVLVLNSVSSERFWAAFAQLLDLVFSKLLYGNFGFFKDPSHYADAIERGLGAWRSFLSFSDPFFLLPFLILLVGFSLIVLFLTKRVSWRAFRMAGFLLTSVTFIVVIRGYIPQGAMPLQDLGSPSALFDSFVPQEERQSYRTYPFMIDYGFSKLSPPTYRQPYALAPVMSQIKYASGWPNINTLVMPSVEGYDPLLPQQLFDTLAAVGSSFGGQYVTSSLPYTENIARLYDNLDVIGMMGGKYIVSGIALASPKLKPLGTYPVSSYKIPLYVYENSYALPRVYFVKEVVASKGALLPGLIREGKKDFTARTYLDCEPCGPPQKSVHASSRVVVSRARNGFFELQVESSTPQWLLVSESNLPGWTARLDGVPMDIVRANGIYMAVSVPGGAHTVVLRYEGVLFEAPLLRRIGFLPSDH